MDLILYNRAMLGKQAWLMTQTQNSLWSKLLKGLYFPTCSFLQVKKGSWPSWGWQSLLTSTDNIVDNVKWTVGTREEISIQEDRWLNHKIIGDPANWDEPTNVADLIIQEETTWDETTHKRKF